MELNSSHFGIQPAGIQTLVEFWGAVEMSIPAGIVIYEKSLWDFTYKEGGKAPFLIRRST